MKTTIHNSENKELDVILFFSQQFKGKGGWDIFIEVEIDGNYKTFKSYTTDAEFIDLISDMKAGDESHETIQKEYYDKFFDLDMEEQINYWIETK